MRIVVSAKFSMILSSAIWKLRKIQNDAQSHLIYIGMEFTQMEQVWTTAVSGGYEA